MTELFVRGTKYTAAFVLPIAMSLIVARPLLLAWLGPAFAAQASNAQLFVSSAGVVNISVAVKILVGTGRLRFMLWFTIALAGPTLP